MFNMSKIKANIKKKLGKNVVIEQGDQILKQKIQPTTENLKKDKKAKNIFIAENRLRGDGSCIIDYYKGYHPFGLEGTIFAICGSVIYFVS